MVYNFLAPNRAVRGNVCVKLERVTLTSMKKSAEPTSLADQRNRASEQTGLAASKLQSSTKIGEPSKELKIFQENVSEARMILLRTGQTHPIAAAPDTRT
jgi:hypothetical protein